MGQNSRFSAYLDENFRYCWKYFTQLFTLHLDSNDHYVPLVFCVLPNKYNETYKKAVWSDVKLIGFGTNSDKASTEKMQHLGLST